MATFINRKAVGKRALVRNILLLIPGIAGHFVILSDIVKGDVLKDILGRIDIVYLTVVGVMIFNSLLMMFLDYYSHTDKSRNRPLKALVQAVQVALVFIGGIVCIAVLIDKPPKALLTGLGLEMKITPSGKKTFLYTFLLFLNEQS